MKQNSEQDLTQNENVRAVHLFLNFTEFEIAQNVLVMFMMAMGALVMTIALVAVAAMALVRQMAMANGDNDIQADEY